MQIRLEDDELILEKLSKLKCDKKGCQTTANYIIFEIGTHSLTQAFSVRVASPRRLTLRLGPSPPLKNSPK